jgi:hypothetical protein
MWGIGKDAEVRCTNSQCRVVNRVRSYALGDAQKCAKCGEPLPERLPARAVRLVYRFPSLLIAFGALVIVVGFSFLDRYVPSMGVIWNAINGKVDGTPYHWIFAVGASLLAVGAILAASKKR